MKIDKIELKPAYDSRGRLTVEAVVYSGKKSASAKSPHGTSSGSYEVEHLPEGEISIAEAKRALLPQLLNREFQKQSDIDEAMKKIDGSQNLSRFGGAVILAISLAAAKLAAKLEKKQLFEYLSDSEQYAMPYPLGKCIGGGVHGRKNSPEIQEFLVLPLGAKNIREAISINNDVHKKTLEEILKRYPKFDKKLDFEGGWNPPISNEEALDVLTAAVEQISDERNADIRIGIDMAASEYFNGRYYVYKREKQEFNKKEQFEYVSKLIKDYKLFYVEDPFEENDFKNHAKLSRKFRNTLIVGDDLFTTNSKRLREGIKEKACNGIIIKPNQIGTVTDTYKTVKLAKKHSYVPVISHRSGETDDASISHMAVAWNIPIIKIGILGRERIVKLKELVEIDRYLKKVGMNNIYLKN
ncbi:phosphopyruvate hydratase [Candidatus Micrarchaeota archaeon]|nr:MAG: phosphopyruvate hydratase [Candidatus Micrarchaeota archaeon]